MVASIPRFDGSKYKLVVKYVKDHWLILLVAMGTVIILWSSGAGGEVVPASTLAPIVEPASIDWFQMIPLR